VVGRVVYYAAGDKVYALDSKAGTELKAFQLREQGGTSPVFAAGGMYIGYESGALTLIR
jgi:hypothetical protein